MSDIRYFIKRPGGLRKTFAIVAYRRDGRLKQYLELPSQLKTEVTSINQRYLTKTLTEGQCESLLSDLIRPSSALRAALTGINQEIFERFWEDVYSIRYLEDPEAPKYGFLKALRLLGDLSIQTASAAEMQQRLRASGARSVIIRKATGHINQILKYLKRDIKLNKPKIGVRQVDYLTLEEFQQVLPHIPEEPIRDLAMTLFATGMRLSEALAATPADFKGNEILIMKQLVKGNKLKLPKAEKTGRSLVLPFGVAALERWLKTGDKGQYRYTLYDRLASACRKANVKPIGPHDLRHSHAIYLLSQGANLTQVALQLRNRIEVCQAYYTGFAHSEGTLNALKRVLGTS